MCTQGRGSIPREEVFAVGAVRMRHSAVNRKVTGSNPVRTAFYCYPDSHRDGVFKQVNSKKIDFDSQLMCLLLTMRDTSLYLESFRIPYSKLTQVILLLSCGSHGIAVSRPNSLKMGNVWHVKSKGNRKWHAPFGAKLP